MNDFIEEHDPTEALKKVFRRHASGVSVITLIDADGNPVGFTATSMTSLGANPPLLSFNVSRGSSSFVSLALCGNVAIHTLGERNVELAKRMAGPAAERFATDDWERGPHNLPIFTDTTAVLIGKIREIHNIEANAVVIVDVEESLLGLEQRGLIYHERGYALPGDRLD